MPFGKTKVIEGILGISDKRQRVGEERRKHLTEPSRVGQRNRKGKELGEMFCRLLLIPGSPALLYFPLSAPTISLSITDFPPSPSAPQGGLSARAGATPTVTQTRVLSADCLSLYFPPSQANSVQRNPLSPPTLSPAPSGSGLHHDVLPLGFICFF